LFAFTTAATVYAQSPDPFIKLPNEIEFKEPFRAGGPSGAVIYGDPKKTGLYVTRVKFSPGLKNMPHWHPDERTVVVLSGTYYFAYGDQWDETKLKPLPAGSFLTEPPKAAHYNWAKWRGDPADYGLRADGRHNHSTEAIGAFQPRTSEIALMLQTTLRRHGGGCTVRLIPAHDRPAAERL